jgi:hypothetical protein
LNRCGCSSINRFSKISRKIFNPAARTAHFDQQIQQLAVAKKNHSWDYLKSLQNKIVTFGLFDLAMDNHIFLIGDPS